jgi:hypothetical protein
MKRKMIKAGDSTNAREQTVPGYGIKRVPCSTPIVLSKDQAVTVGGEYKEKPVWPGGAVYPHRQAAISGRQFGGETNDTRNLYLSKVTAVENLR